MNEIPPKSPLFLAELGTARLSAAADSALADRIEALAALMWSAGGELNQIANAAGQMAAGVVGAGFRVVAVPDRAAWKHDRTRIVLLVLEPVDEFEDTFG